MGGCTVKGASSTLVPGGSHMAQPAMHSVIWIMVWTKSDNLEPRQMNSSPVKVDLKALRVN